MKKVYKIDSNGFYVSDVILNDDDYIPSNCVEIELPDGLFKPQYINGNWQNGITQDEYNDILGNDLNKLKQIKLEQLINACNNAILGTFPAQVDGVTYLFSNDFSAQSNFKDAKDAWSYGYIPSDQTLKWTVYDSNGKVVRLDLTEKQFDPVNMARMTWQQTNVAKLRDVLEPQVNAATNQTDLDKIKWD